MRSFPDNRGAFFIGRILPFATPDHGSSVCVEKRQDESLVPMGLSTADSVG